jgi:vacuolar-type H+-ATPase subunit I/STV1
MFWKTRTKPSPPPRESSSAHGAGSALNITIIETEEEKSSADDGVPTPSLSQIVERKTWEHGQLRQKLLCLQEKYQAALRLYQVVVEITVTFQDALVAFESLDIDCEDNVGTEHLPTTSHATGILQALEPVDMRPAKRQVTMSAIQASQESTQPAGRMSTANLSRMIEQRTGQNAQLEQELAYLELKHRAVKYFYKKVVSIVAGLKDALQNFDSLHKTTGCNSDTSPALTALDIKIANNHGTTMAIEASREAIQAAKKMPTPDLSQMIRERTRQIMQLEQELLCLEQKYGAAEYLYQEILLVLSTLQEALRNFGKLSADAKVAFEDHLV